MNTILYQPIVDAMVVEYPFQVLWALTTTVRQQLVLVTGNLLFSTLMTHFGMDKVVVDLIERTCCDPSNLPWFCKKLPQSTTDYLEVCICGDENLSNEDTPIDIVQLYIQ